MGNTPHFPPQPQPPKASTILNKSPYISKPDKDPQPPPINVMDNISKFIQDDKIINVDKSIIIGNNSLRPPGNEAEVQTDDPNVDRSSFLISKVVQKVPQIMNEQNFRKNIKELNQEISNLKIELNSEDLIIDLSDLILTKGTKLV